MWSPLARDRLTRPRGTETSRTRDDAFGQSLYRQTEDSDREIGEEVGRIAERRGVPRAQVALAWVTQQPGVSTTRS